jgi:hypothetical protein
VTHRASFQEEAIGYEVRSQSASDVYEKFEPFINGGEVELLDDPTTTEQFISLVWRGGKITHEPGSHDDHSNAVALGVNSLREQGFYAAYTFAGIAYEPVVRASDYLPRTAMPAAKWPHRRG